MTHKTAITLSPSFFFFLFFIFIIIIFILFLIYFLIYKEKEPVAFDRRHTCNKGHNKSSRFQNQVR